MSICYCVCRMANNPVSSSQYVKQEMKAKIAARAQKQHTSPVHQNFSNQQQQQAMTASQQMAAMMSPLPSSTSSPGHHLSKIGSDPYTTSFSTTANLQSGVTESVGGYEDRELPDDILNQSK